MSLINIQQDGNLLIITSKSIEWLTHHTEVSIFDPVHFDGYQRQIDENHCLKIVNYLQTSCFLPSAIICACEKYDEDVNLRIVDGQHRIAAFKLLAEKSPERYNLIKYQEIPVVVMVGVPLTTEIQTFITINKTSKKVDTSLAYVLKNKLSKPGDDMVMSRAEYVAVEVAQLLNEEEECGLWANKILYEGFVKKSNRYISLNAFVRATRILVNTFNQIGVINLNWNSDTKEEDVHQVVEKTHNLIIFIWETVYQRWPEMKNASFEEKQILQGAIGYTAITKTLVKSIKHNYLSSGLSLKSFISKTILSFNVPYYQWTRDGAFSKYSSDSGYKIVSEALIHGIEEENI